MRSNLKIAAVAGAGITIGGVLLAGSRRRARHPVGNKAVPEPAKPVDIDRYGGVWHELARYEQAFERGCRAVTAEYRPRPDGRIDVINRCHRLNRREKIARGVATIVDTTTNAKLKVRFFGPFSGDYWVLDHADDYEWSIVGEPSGRYLWILTRQTLPNEATAQELIERAAILGYDPSMLVRCP